MAKDKKHEDKTEEDTQNHSEEEVVDVERLVSEEKEKRLRVIADFENYKKRIESEKATFGAIANMGIIKDLLEVNDDMQLALNDEELDLNRAKEAIENAQRKLVAAAQNAGIEKIDVKIGDEFDKNFMEAISMVPDEKNKNKVIAVISSAFKYSGQDNILQTAKVIVGK